MNKIWILPMAGKGTRTYSFGPCKPAISIYGRPICSWCLLGLKKHISPSDKIYAITTNYFQREFDLEFLLKKALEDYEIDAEFELITLLETPPGPAASVYAAREYIPLGNYSLVVVNIDQFCDFEFPSFKLDWDAFLPIYFNNTGKSSYASVINGKIINLEEKKLISNHASAGVYGFRKYSILFEQIDKAMKLSPHRDGEYFIAPILSKMALEGKLILPTSVYAKYDLGDVNGINRFKDFVSLIS